MKKNAKKNLAQFAKELSPMQMIEASKAITLKGGSQGVSTFDLVL